MATSEMKFGEETPARCEEPHPTPDLESDHLEDEPAVAGSRVPPTAEG